ncbi:MAG: DNA/RNA non-specific endonuclease [bacterium]|nr:DNA/RNA non-specific endonuclease [bacterium]
MRENASVNGASFASSSTQQRKEANGSSGILNDQRSLAADQRLLQKSMQSTSSQGTAIQMAPWSTGALDGKQTDVDWQTATLEGDTVGVKMKATVLGPDHKQGSAPKSSAQPNLMAGLPTDPNLPNKDKFIRGHLLNDNLGGEGLDYNLFPITANANKQHHDLIEKTVKDWVNRDRMWVQYSVNVMNTSDPYDSGFQCQAQILDPTDLKPKGASVSATIYSKLSHKMNAYNEYDESIDAPTFDSETEARNHSVLLSSAKRLKSLKIEGTNMDVLESLAYLFDQYPSETKQSLLNLKGVGTTTVNVLMDICEDEIPNEISETDLAAFKRLEKSYGDLLAYVTQQFFELESDY